MSIQASKKLNTSHFLGIDYGKAKVGLAIGNGETRMAFGYGVLKNDKKLWQKLAEIVKKEGIEKIIVGSPALSLRRAQRRGNLGQYNKTRDCFATLAMTSYNEFGKNLKSKLKIPIEFQNEIFTTKMAKRNLIEKGAKKIKRYDDEEAARIILQSWLDKKA